MRRTLSSLTALSLLSALLPLSAFAAAASPSILLLNWASYGKTMSTTYEAHLQFNDGETEAYFSLWGKGTQEGKFSLKNDAKMDITADVVVPKESVKIRMKLNVLVADGDMYLKLQSVDGTMDHELATISGKVVGKKWLMVAANPLLESGPEDPFEAFSAMLTEMGMEMSAADLRTLFAQVMDGALAMQTKELATGTEYTLTLKRHFLQETLTNSSDFLAKLSGTSMELTDADLRELMKVEREVLRAMKFSAVIRTTKSGEPVSMNMNLDFRVPEAGLAFTLKSSGQAVKGPFSVMAPAGAVSIEKILEMDGIDLFEEGLEELSPFGGSDDWESDMEDDEWEETWEGTEGDSGDAMEWDSGAEGWEVEMPSDPCDPATLEGQMMLRRGKCGRQSGVSRHMKR